MREPLSLAAPSARVQVLLGLVLGAVAVGALLAPGRLPVSAFVAVLCALAYSDLRRLLAPWGHALTFVLGGAGVLGLLWSGYVGRLEYVAWAGAAIVLVLLTTRVLIFEVRGQSNGATGDVAATLGSAAVVGVLGAHVLLIRVVPRVGFRGLVVFGAAVVLNDAVSFFAGRWRGRHKLASYAPPTKTWGRYTWKAAVAGFTASVLVGLVAGLVLDPPFGIRSGLAFGAGMGVVAPVGDFAFSTIKRSAGVKGSGSYLGPLGGALDVVDSVLFAAPAFYWAFRTIAL